MPFSQLDLQMIDTCKEMNLTWLMLLQLALFMAHGVEHPTKQTDPLASINYPSAEDDAICYIPYLPRSKSQLQNFAQFGFIHKTNEYSGQFIWTKSTTVQCGSTVTIKIYRT